MRATLELSAKRHWGSRRRAASKCVNAGSNASSLRYALPASRRTPRRSGSRASARSKLSAAARRTRPGARGTRRGSPRSPRRDRLGGDQPIEQRHRFGIAPALVVILGEVRERRRMVGLGRERSREELGGLGRVAERAVNEADVVEKRRVSRCRRQRAKIVLQRLLGIAAIAAGVAETEQRFRLGLRTPFVVLRRRGRRADGAVAVLVAPAAAAGA